MRAGNHLERELGLGAERIQAGRIEDHQPALSSGWGN